MPTASVSVLGVRIDIVSELDVLSFVESRITAHAPAQIVTVNAEFVIQAQSNGDFAAALSGADLATPDSFLVLWALKRAGFRLRKRVGGSDLIWRISEQAARDGWRIFLLGSAEGVAAAAAERLQVSYPGLNVAGTFAGSPSQEQEAYIVDLIRRSRADILFVAFGAPAQDVWIARNLQESGAIVGMGVGGSFDYVAGRVRRAPVWMRERGLEWLWRLLRQPSRWRRMLALPRFIWLLYTRND